MKNVQEPLNAEERYLHGINVRLNVLIEMFSSFLEVYAKEEDIATSENTEDIEVKVEEEELEGQMVMEEVEKEPKELDSDLTVAEIKDILDELEIPYTSKDRKSDLLGKLE